MNLLALLNWKPTHQHYKGGLYRVLTNNATIEATMQPAVIYDDKEGNVWVRTANNFYEEVDTGIDNLTVPRFKELK